GNAVAVEQFCRLSATRQLADGEPANGQAGRSDSFAHRVADAARRVMILDGDNHALGRLAGGNERTGIYWLNRVGVDDPDIDALRLQLFVRLARFEHRDSSADDRG